MQWWYCRQLRIERERGVLLYCLPEFDCIGSKEREWLSLLGADGQRPILAALQSTLP